MSVFLWHSDFFSLLLNKKKRRKNEIGAKDDSIKTHTNGFSVILSMFHILYTYEKLYVNIKRNVTMVLNLFSHVMKICYKKTNVNNSSCSERAKKNGTCNLSYFNIYAIPPPQQFLGPSKCFEPNCLPIWDYYTL